MVNAKASVNVEIGANVEEPEMLPFLEAEWRFYEGNRDELVEKYLGKYVVISGDRVLAVYDDENFAYFETVKTVPLGSFMIHRITEEEEVFQLSPFVGV